MNESMNKHIKIECVAVGLVDINDKWYNIRATIPAGGRAILTTTQIISKNNNSLITTLDETTSNYQAGPVFDRSWLKISKVDDENFLNIIVDDRCLIIFYGWVGHNKNIDKNVEERMSLRRTGL